MITSKYIFVLFTILNTFYTKFFFSGTINNHHRMLKIGKWRRLHVVPWQNLFWNLFKAVIQWKQGNDNFQAINLTKLLRLLIKPVSFTKFEFLVLFCQKGDFNLTCSMDPKQLQFFENQWKISYFQYIFDNRCFMFYSTCGVNFGIFKYDHNAELKFMLKKL